MSIFDGPRSVASRGTHDRVRIRGPVGKPDQDYGGGPAPAEWNYWINQALALCNDGIWRDPADSRATTGIAGILVYTNPKLKTQQYQADENFTITDDILPSQWNTMRGFFQDVTDGGAYIETQAEVGFELIKEITIAEGEVYWDPSVDGFPPPGTPLWLHNNGTWTMHKATAPADKPPCAYITGSITDPSDNPGDAMHADNTHDPISGNWTVYGRFLGMSANCMAVTGDGLPPA